MTTWDTHNDHVLALVRRTKEETLVGLFNFTGQEQTVSLDAMEGAYTDLVTGEACACSDTRLGPCQYRLCRRR